jgi:hypothetical protein
MRDPVFQLLNDIALERMRLEERSPPEHDDVQDMGELARAAAAYALVGAAGSVPGHLPIRQILTQRSNRCWPFDERGPKPRPAREAYLIACALLMAELERIDRRDGRQTPLDRTGVPHRFRRSPDDAESHPPTLKIGGTG